MTVESASYISQLDTTLPTAADLISEGDDHLRLTKTVLKTQFPNFGTTAITASAAEVNYLVGLTGAIQPQLSNQVAGPVHAATDKTTPVDADELGITDSAASWALKKLTFANLAAWIRGIALTGLSTATNAAITSADTVLTAFGKLQKQITDLDAAKFAKTGGNITGNALLTSGGGLGYGAGSGGTVSQATNKTTGVTLNKPSGYITTFAGSIAANSNAAFQVSNSTVGDGDTITVNLVGGVTSGTVYMVDAQAVGAGGFYIIVRNVTGTATPSGDAPTIQFNVHKGARS